MENIEQSLVDKYLLRHFPVVRIKDKKHFKRAIALNDSFCLLNSNNNRVKVKEFIINDISNVFGIDKPTVKKLTIDYIIIN